METLAPTTDEVGGYRNDYGKPSKLTMGCGTVTVRRPRVRSLEQLCESRILVGTARPGGGRFDF